MNKSIHYIESVESFDIIFSGKNNIDAELFTSTINNTIELLRESVLVISPNCFLRLEINSTSDGSFKACLDAIVKFSQDMITPTTIAANILKGTVDFFNIKKHLNGNKPKKIREEEGQIVILNQEGKSMTVPSNIGNAFLRSNKIDKLIINITTSLEQYKRDGLIINTNGENAEIKEKDFPSMSKSVIDESNIVANTEKQEPIKVNLLLKKPDLLGSSQWEFLYTKVINAKIQDQEFLEKVRKGKIKNLYAGVRLPVLLQIEYDIDDNYNIVPNSDKYTILQVTGSVIEPVEQENLDLIL